jgi:hypothetical protein
VLRLAGAAAFSTFAAIGMSHGGTAPPTNVKENQ